MAAFVSVAVVAGLAAALRSRLRGTVRRSHSPSRSVRRHDWPRRCATARYGAELGSTATVISCSTISCYYRRGSSRVDDPPRRRFPLSTGSPCAVGIGSSIRVPGSGCRAGRCFATHSVARGSAQCALVKEAGFAVMFGTQCVLWILSSIR